MGRDSSFGKSSAYYAGDPGLNKNIYIQSWENETSAHSKIVSYGKHVDIVYCFIKPNIYYGYLYF